MFIYLTSYTLLGKSTAIDTGIVAFVANLPNIVELRRNLVKSTDVEIITFILNAKLNSHKDYYCSLCRSEL